MNRLLKLPYSFCLLAHLYMIVAGNFGFLESKVIDRRSLGSRLDLNKLLTDEEVEKHLEGLSCSNNPRNNLIDFGGSEYGQREAANSEWIFPASHGQPAFKPCTRSKEAKDHHVGYTQPAPISGLQDSQHGYPMVHAGNLGLGKLYAPNRSDLHLDEGLYKGPGLLLKKAVPTTKLRDQPEANEWAEKILKNCGHQASNPSVHKDKMLRPNFVQPTELPSNIGSSKSASAFKAYQTPAKPPEHAKITDISDVLNFMDQEVRLSASQIKHVESLGSQKRRKTEAGRFSESMFNGSAEQDTEPGSSTTQDVEMDSRLEQNDLKRGQSMSPLRRQKRGRPKRRKSLFEAQMPQGDQGVFDFQKESSYISSMKLIQQGRGTRMMHNSGTLASLENLQLANLRDSNSLEQNSNISPIEAQLRWAYGQQRADIKRLIHLIRGYSDWIGDGSHKNFEAKDIVIEMSKLGKTCSRVVQFFR
ncbi:uncharacterized protein MELLADRAFT_59284 [Melampsora larici-populina 98AG31]|uniref:Uncharacterized protein n=1 Tax=Melampsora larici-populina (strain 98AG31 / pathotype 3-4-7) TaxID=747676 RepID=F4R5Q2_MELLP|nr:uncharacterized protein MELLADRAFT_59284 [Melampsora larici-populina 98AG31]EGG12086.1 hypothetical protein MELLADRAFT_59284 [Melampsora larici-populina 98AG31]